MRIAIDTNRYTDFMRGDAKAGEVFGRASQLVLPLPVLGELRAGFLFGKQGPQNESVLNAFLNQSRVRVLAPDEQTTFHYARLYRQLREQGTPIPTNDLWIASLVAQYNLLLFSRDRHFDVIPQLARVN